MTGLWTPGSGDPEPPAGQGGPSGLQQPGPGGPEAEPSPEEIAALRELHAQLAATPVENVIVNHAFGIWQLALVHLGVVTPPDEQGRTPAPNLAAAGRFRRLSGPGGPLGLGFATARSPESGHARLSFRLDNRGKWDASPHPAGIPQGRPRRVQCEPDDRPLWFGVWRDGGSFPQVKYPPSFSRRRQNEEEMLWPQTTPASTTAFALVKSGSLEPTVRNSV